MGLGTLFVRRDARRTGLPERKYKVVIMMASSFGYFVEEVQNQQILCEAHRLLMPGGLLLLDLPNSAYVRKTFTPRSWHEADAQIVVCRHRRLEKDVIYSREMVISKTDGLIRDASYCTRLYSPDTISALLESAGFDTVRIQRSFVSHQEEVDYGLMTKRMIVIGAKKGESTL
jgi:hypothetical protein